MIHGIGQVKMMRIVARHRHTFEMKVVTLDGQANILDIIIPRTHVLDTGPNTYSEMWYEWYWKVLHLLRL